MQQSKQASKQAKQERKNPIAHSGTPVAGEKSLKDYYCIVIRLHSLKNKTERKKAWPLNKGTHAHATAEHTNASEEEEQKYR